MVFDCSAYTFGCFRNNSLAVMRRQADRRRGCQLPAIFYLNLLNCVRIGNVLNDYYFTCLFCCGAIVSGQCFKNPLKIRGKLISMFH